MAETDENVYVVAPGVTVYGTEREFHEGEVITPADVGSLTNFRTLLARGKIVLSDGGGGEDPGDDSEWNYTDIDESLNPDSPNPVSNRALCKVFDAVDKTDAAMAQRIAALEDAQAEPIPQEDIRNLFAEEAANGA